MKHKQSIECWIFHTALKKFLLLQCPETDRHPRYWQPVTGGVNSGETLPQACVREVEEETGLLFHVAEALVVLDEYHVFVPEYDLDVCKPIFTVQTGSEQITISDEHLAYHWASVPEIPSMLYWESNKASFERVQRFYTAKSAPPPSQ